MSYADHFEGRKMHIVVSWDIAAGPKRSEIEQQMIDVLKPYPWVRPLTTFYILPATVGQRASINAALSSIANSVSQEVQFLISPLMGGSYMGRHSDWASINARAE